MNRSLTRVVGLAGALWVLAGCGGNETPKAGTMCIQNSDCNNPLSCTGGKCHNQCKETRDCPNGARCVKDSMNQLVCLLPEETRCALNSQCNPPPLVCAKDLQCRNQCEADRDCGKGQKCIEKSCAEMNEYDPVTMTLLPPPASDGGTAGTGGSVDANMGAGGAGGSTSDGGAGSGGSTGDASVAPGTDGGGPTTPIPVSGVMVDKPIVRQGEVGVLATVTATMGGLANPSNIDIGGCRGTVMEGATDTMFVIRVSCPHGTPIGAKDLKFQTSKGVGMYPAVLTVSAITASPTGKDENRGTSDQPYRTFKKAISVADTGDTVELKDGMYTKDSGEDFMAAIPTKITIVGQSAQGTQLIGPSDASIRVDGIRLREAGDLTVKNITFGFFEQGIYLDKTANLTLENVRVVRTRSQGVYITTGAENSKINWTGDESEISDHASRAVQIYAKGTTFNYKGKGVISSTAGYIFQVQVDDSNVTLDGPTLTAGMMMPTAQVLSFYNGQMSNHTVTLNNVTVHGQSDIGGKDKSTVTITGSTFHLPSTYTGTHLDFTGAKMTVRKTTFNGGGYALQLRSGDVSIRETKFKDYYYYGLYVHTVKALELGTMMVPGANEFDPNPMYASSYAIYDSRPAAPEIITVSETTVGGNLLVGDPATGKVYMGPGAAGAPKTFYIQQALNKIVVY